MNPVFNNPYVITNRYLMNAELNLVKRIVDNKTSNFLNTNYII